jgi:hypothetical protein
MRSIPAKYPLSPDAGSENAAPADAAALDSEASDAAADVAIANFATEATAVAVSFCGQLRRLTRSRRTW